MKLICSATLLIGIMFSASSTVHSADWIPVGASYEIDRSGRRTDKDGTIYVWVKSVLRENIQKKLVADLREAGVFVDFTRYSHSIGQWRFDCRARTAACLRGTDYDMDGEVINAWEYPTEMSPVFPDSISETLLESACSLKARKGH